MNNEEIQPHITKEKGIVMIGAGKSHAHIIETAKLYGVDVVVVDQEMSESDAIERMNFIELKTQGRSNMKIGVVSNGPPLSSVDALFNQSLPDQERSLKYINPYNPPPDYTERKKLASLPKVKNLYAEYELIKNKQSKLSRRDRDVIVNYIENQKP